MNVVFGSYFIKPVFCLNYIECALFILCGIENIRRSALVGPILAKCSHMISYVAYCCREIFYVVSESR